jgi:hypothetical protein
MILTNNVFNEAKVRPALRGYIRSIAISTERIVQEELSMSQPSHVSMTHVKLILIRKFGCNTH